MELTRAEKHVHNFMMDTQLTKRVSCTQIHTHMIKITKSNRLKSDWITLNMFSSHLSSLLVKKCSGQCIKRNLVNLQKYQTCETGECVKGQDSSAQVPTGYIRVSINWYKAHSDLNGMLELDSKLNGM